jgi:hypothetical protein
MSPLPAPDGSQLTETKPLFVENGHLYSHLMVDLYKNHVSPDSDINHKIQSERYLAETLRQFRPQDPTEAMLCSQMLTCHNLLMGLAQRVQSCQTFEAQERLLKQLNRLQNTFNDTVRTLEKYRNKGRQVVQVQHVTVANGGQAMIGQQAGG